MFKIICLQYFEREESSFVWQLKEWFSIVATYALLDSLYVYNKYYNLSSHPDETRAPNITFYLQMTISRYLSIYGPITN